MIEILLATYQGERYLKEQLDSLLQQTHRPLRILVRDDGSSDSTKTIIHSYASKYPNLIVPIPSGANVGVRQNFFLLLKASTAPYIMFCDQDDVWHADKVALSFQRMRQLEAQYRGPCLVHTDVTVVDQHLHTIATSFWKYAALDVEENPSFPRLCLRNQVTGCTMMMNHSLRNLIHSMPAETVMHDFWIALVAAAFGHIGIVNQPTMLYRQHGNNILGAKKFSWWRWIKQGLIATWKGERGKNFQNLLMQAQIFNHQYQAQMKHADKEWLSRFLILPTLPLTQRLALAKKVGLFHSPSLRTWAQGACLLLPQKKNNKNL